jgi:hypothetical protein
MSKPLDGVALHAYFHRLGFSRVTQDLLIRVRNSPPSRTPGARRGNMPVWYPSKKMQCIIKAESAKGIVNLFVKLKSLQKRRTRERKEAEEEE